MPSDLQLDLLSKTMGIMEERLTPTESRVSSMIASQRSAAYQQQRAYIEHSDVADVRATTAPAPATASVIATANIASSAVPSAVPTTNNASTAATAENTTSSSASKAPSVAELRTVQLRVMCRQYGLDATGTEAELLKRLNDSVAATGGAANANARGPSYAPASDMDDSVAAESEQEQEEVKGDGSSAEEESYSEEEDGSAEGEAVQFYAEDNFEVC